MSWLPRAATLYRRLIHRTQVEKELDEEVQGYFEIWVERFIEQGLSRDEAIRAARIKFEGPEQVKEKVREARVGVAIDNLLRDIKYGSRALWRDKGFATTVILTVVLCIGANTATFAIVNSVLLRPLPGPDAERIVLMANRYPKAGVDDLNKSSIGDYYDRLQGVTALEEQAMFRPADLTIGINQTPVLVPGMSVTPSFFGLVQARAARGRTFTTEEGEIGNSQKVILSDSFWRQRYAGDPSAIGRDLRIGGRPYTIVGVMPRDFVFMNPAIRFWVPLAFAAAEKSTHHSNNWYHIGRLKPGATLAQVQSQIDAVNAANLRRFPQFRELLVNADFHSVVEPLQHMLVRDVEAALYLIWGGAVCVLLIGMLNLANISLARLTVRRKEIATQFALGASRTQVLQQLAVENLMLVLAGGLGGAVLGVALLRILQGIGLDRLPRAFEIRVDGFVIAMALAMALAVGLVIGLLHLAGIRDISLCGTLRNDSRTGTSSKGTRRLRQIFVAAEIGFAFVLVAGAGLLVTTIRHLLAVDPGFATAGIVTASTNAPHVKYPEVRDLDMLINRALASIRLLPGVRAAGATTTIPFGGDYSDSVILAEGYEFQPGESIVSPRRSAVTPGYFEVMQVGLLRGRYFNESDTPATAPVVIVDERLARRFWPNRDPIGRRMYTQESPSKSPGSDAKTRWFKVVGVVRSVRLEDLAGTGSPVGAYYFPYSQHPSWGYTFAIKTDGDSSVIERMIRAEMARIDSDMALFDVRTMVERAELSISSRRMVMMLALGFGTVALFLSAIGIYGVLAYLVTQRRREIGIRVAVGSTGFGIVKLVLREGLLLVCVGVALGFAASAALQNVVTSQIYGVQALDPLVLGTVASMLAAIAFCACIAPARRALRVDPVTVLNEQ